MRSSWQPYAVVFAGGGALAAWEIGCLEAIIAHERAWPSTVIGTSAGAINAAGICAGYDLEGLRQLWIDLQPGDVFRSRYSEWAAFGANFLYHAATTANFARALRRACRQFHSVFDAAPLESTLRRIYVDRSSTLFRSETNFALAMTDLMLGRRVTLYKPGKNYLGPVPQSTERRIALSLDENIDGLIDALMATCAIPLLFSPHEVRLSGHVLRGFDGGVLRNCPIGPAVEFGETKIYVLIPSPGAPRLAFGVVDICQTLVETWVASSFESQLELIAHLNEARKEAGQDPIVVHTIRPAIPLEVYGVNQLAFGKNVTRVIDLGKEDATIYLKTSHPGVRIAPAPTYTMPSRSRMPLRASFSILNRIRSIDK